MKEIKILIFKLGNEFYATDIMEVERILGYEEPTVLPDSPEFLFGVIDYETNVLPIISLAKKFKIKETGNLAERKIIVLKREEGKFGIAVDSVSEVQSISEEDIKNPESLATLISKKYINGFVKKNDKIIILINLDKILTVQEEELIFRGE